MYLFDWKVAFRLMPLIMVIGASHYALGQDRIDSPGQQIREAEPMEGSPLKTFLNPDVNEPGGGFDVLARSFSKKKRSELINLKAYSDEEWERAVSAVHANRKACRKGDAEGCMAAGDAYVSGDGVWPVSAIAYILYRDACDKGLGAGCRAIVETGVYDYLNSENASEADRRLLEKACDLGDLIGCDRFAYELRASFVAPADLARSDAILESACKAGGIEACVSIGELLMQSVQPEDQNKAADLLDTMCRNAALQACQIMANNWQNRSDPDEWRISQYKHYSCYLESVVECLDMGERAYSGMGVAENHQLAFLYYAKACHIESAYCQISESLRTIPQLRSACSGGDDTQSCAALGRALSLTLSPARDSKTAFHLLESSCRNGTGRDCYAASELLDFKDPARSERRTELLERGCQADVAEVCFKLARALEEGLKKADLKRAVELYIRLCDASFPQACAYESKYAGIVPSARIMPADESFIAPFTSDGAPDVLRPSSILEACFTGSERFRGKTYVQFNCDRSEKGIGSQPARPGQAPWQALLWRPEILAGNRLSAAQRVLCGGSVIAQGWVLTAAHCLTDNGTTVLDGGHRVRLGVYNPSENEGISYPILRVIPHPQYNASNRFVFDIALIRYDHRAGSVASARAKMNPVHSISLDPLEVGQRKIVKGMPVYSFGWGWTEAENSNSTDYLQIVKMELSSESACTALTKFTNALSNAALCAGGKSREQTCFGDSGGPLIFYGDSGKRPILMGVVSAGKKCGTTGKPSQYTRVAKVKNWIASHVPGMR
jgi:TPR repeat protein